MAGKRMSSVVATPAVMPACARNATGTASSSSTSARTLGRCSMVRTERSANRDGAAGRLAANRTDAWQVGPLRVHHEAHLERTVGQRCVAPQHEAAPQVSIDRDDILRLRQLVAGGVVQFGP